MPLQARIYALTGGVLTLYVAEFVTGSLIASASFSATFAASHVILDSNSENLLFFPVCG